MGVNNLSKTLFGAREADDRNNKHVRLFQAVGPCEFEEASNYKRVCICGGK